MTITSKGVTIFKCFTALKSVLTLNNREVSDVYKQTESKIKSNSLSTSLVMQPFCFRLIDVRRGSTSQAVESNF